MKTHLFVSCIFIFFTNPNLAIKNNEKSNLTGYLKSSKYADCGELGIYFDQEICLENGYHITEPPDRKETTVYISFDILFVKEVDDHKKMLTFEVRSSVI